MMEMSRKLYDALSEALRDRYGEDEALMDDYSGRYMYGSLCLAMTCQIPDFYAELYRLKDEEGWGNSDEVDRFFEEAPTLNWDSLGLGMVFYFPNVHVEGAGEYDDDEEEEEDDE